MGLASSRAMQMSITGSSINQPHVDGGAAAAAALHDELGEHQYDDFVHSSHWGESRHQLSSKAPAAAFIPFSVGVAGA